MATSFFPTRIVASIAALVIALTVSISMPGRADANIEYHKVVVVGGGISGLVAGYYLADQDVLVLEKNDYPGGRAVSGTISGISYAKGAEYLGPPDGPLKEIIDNLDIDLYPISAPMDAVYHDGRIVYGWNGITELFVSEVGVKEYNRFVQTVLEESSIAEQAIDQLASTEPYALPGEVENRARELDTMSAAQWLEDRGFSEAFNNHYNVSTRGLFGATLDEISALCFLSEAAFDFTGEDPFIHSLDDLQSPQGEQDFEAAFTPLDGLSEIAQTIADHLGNRVRLNSRVTEVVRDGDWYLVRYVDGGGARREISTDMVILAVPAPVALKIGPDVLSQEQKEILTGVQYSRYATVTLFSREPLFEQAFDLSMPNGMFFTDVYDSLWVRRNAEPDSARVKNLHINGVYVAPSGLQDQGPIVLSESKIESRVLEELDRVFPGASSKVMSAEVEKFTYGYPVMVPGHYENLVNLLGTNHGTMLLAGDHTTYPTFEAAAWSGFRAASMALEELGE